MTNARCLSEGVDVPSLDGVAFIDPRSSVVDIIQAVGRAIRKSKDKSHGFIILPVYLGGLEDDESEILKSRFADIWKVILALKSQDDALSASLDQIRIDAGKNQPKSLSSLLPKKIALDLPVGISTDFQDALSAKLVSSTTDSWNEHYGRLLKFREEHGHLSVPARTPFLGRWCHKQRQAQRRGTLSPERHSLLEQIGFIWDPLDALWYESFSEYVDYRKETGKIALPQGSALASWAARQRLFRKQGKLPQERIDLLDQHGFPWDPVDSFWMQNYEKLVRHLGLGNPVPTGETPIGRWLREQRRAYRKGSLQQKYLDLLNQMGIPWDRYDDQWEKQFLDYQEYIDQHGGIESIPHLPPSKTNQRLRSWVNRQRTQKRDGHLSQERIERLDRIGFIWNARDFDWMQRLQKLKRYVEENGEIPRLSQPGIGYWVDRRRFDYKQGKLSQERIDLLEAIPGWAWVLTTGRKAGEN